MGRSPREPQERIRRGRSEAPGTPRDVIHILIGSFAVPVALVLAVAAYLSGAIVLTVVLIVIAIGAVVDIVLAVRRQKGLGAGPRSRG
ncbi:MAG TPA: hypothetical protein VIR33_14460 [Thermopolyspora sp.]|jgi:hypothetical protein